MNIETGQCSITIDRKPRHHDIPKYGVFHYTSKQDEGCIQAEHQ